MLINMPFDIEYTDDGGVEFRATESLTGDEVLKTISDFFERPDFPSLKYWLIDRSSCLDYSLTPEDVQRIAALHAKGVEKNPELILALVSGNDHQFGMSRMFEATTRDDAFETEVFRSRDDALQWIYSHPSIRGA